MNRLERLSNYMIQHWTLMLGFTIVLFFSLNFTGFGMEFLPGDWGDGRFNNYLLEHSYRYFTLSQKTFWNAPFMCPEPKVLSYSDNLVGSAPIYSVFRILSFSQETSFQLWFYAMNFLNFWACYRFLKWCLKSAKPAVIGGLLFALSISIASQLPHAQTFPRFASPLCLWAIMLFAKDLRPKHLFWAVLAFVYQFYCAIYLGFFLLIPFAIICCGIVLFRFKSIFQKLKSIKWIAKVTGILVLPVLLLLPLMYPYYERSINNGLLTFDEVIITLPTIESFFTSSKGTLFWDFMKNTAADLPFPYNHTIFIGGLGVLGFIGFLMLVILKGKTLILDRSKLSHVLMFLTGIIMIIIFLELINLPFILSSSTFLDTEPCAL